MKKIYFGHAFKTERSRAGKTLKETARALGVSESFLSRVENGGCAPPREETIISAAEFFGVAPDDLIYAAVRQREGVHTILSKRTVEAYGRLLQQFHQLEPAEIEQIDAILLRHSPSVFRSSAPATTTVGTTSRASRRRGRAQAPIIKRLTSVTGSVKEDPQPDTPRIRKATRAAGTSRAQRTARIKHSPRSDLKTKEDSYDQETVVH
jgi:transcriptional regulator with XRE-family HTH domain